MSQVSLFSSYAYWLPLLHMIESAEIEEIDRIAEDDCDRLSVVVSWHKQQQQQITFGVQA